MGKRKHFSLIRSGVSVFIITARCVFNAQFSIATAKRNQVENGFTKKK